MVRCAPGRRSDVYSIAASNFGTGWRWCKNCVSSAKFHPEFSDVCEACCGAWSVRNCRGRRVSLQLNLTLSNRLFTGREIPSHCQSPRYWPSVYPWNMYPTAILSSDCVTHQKKMRVVESLLVNQIDWISVYFLS